MKARKDRIFIVPVGVLLCFSLSSCSSSRDASNEDIKGTIYYDAVVAAWNSLNTGAQPMFCGWADDEDREPLYATFSISFKFDQNIQLNDENKPNDFLNHAVNGEVLTTSDWDHNLDQPRSAAIMEVRSPLGESPTHPGS